MGGKTTRLMKEIEGEGEREGEREQQQKLHTNLINNTERANRVRSLSMAAICPAFLVELRNLPIKWANSAETQLKH